MESKHDQAFLQILREEKNITNFLDAFFGFLYRCTDFYVESNPQEKLGFPHGIAEKLVSSSFKKWSNIYEYSYKSTEDEDDLNVTVKHEKEEDTTLSTSIETHNISNPVQEIIVDSSENYDEDNTSSVQNTNEDAEHQLVQLQLSDSYNGAIRDNYVWSQSISDLDVIVKLPNCLRSAKDLRLTLESKEIKVEARTSILVENCNNYLMLDISDSEWTPLFQGELCFKIKKDESVWSLVSGQHVSIHLEKASERWWEALIEGEPKIELNKIDCVRNLDEMGQTEQMKIEELMWNHQQKLLGKPTSEQVKMEKILKQAWNADGSPFQGTPYDPSVVKFS